MRARYFRCYTFYCKHGSKSLLLPCQLTSITILISLYGLFYGVLEMILYGHVFLLCGAYVHHVHDDHHGFALNVYGL